MKDVHGPIGLRTALAGVAGMLLAISALLASGASAPTAQAQAAPAAVLTADTDGNQFFCEVAGGGVVKTLNGPLVVTYVWVDSGPNVPPGTRFSPTLSVGGSNVLVPLFLGEYRLFVPRGATLTFGGAVASATISGFRPY